MNTKEILYKRSDVKLLLETVLQVQRIIKPSREGFGMLVNNVIESHQNDANSFVIKYKRFVDEKNKIPDNIKTYWEYANDKPTQYTGTGINAILDTIAEWLYYERGYLIDIERSFFESVTNYLKAQKLNSNQFVDLQTSGLRITEKIKSEDALHKLVGTSWWLYCYNEESFDDSDWTGVTRFLVEIRSLDKNGVIIHHLDNFFESDEISNHDCDYVGFLKMHGSSNARLIFELKHNGGRDLHILLHTVDGAEKKAAWLTGQYHNVTRSGKIVSGKVLFQNNREIKEEDRLDKSKAIFFIKDYFKFLRATEESTKAKEVIHRIQSFENLPLVVQGTFFRKSLSFISVPNHSTEAGIRKWNNEEVVDFSREAQEIEYKYQFFISGPATLLPHNEYKSFRTQVLALKNKLEEWYDCKGKVFTMFEENTLIDYDTAHKRPKQLFEKLVDNLRASRIFIMLYHDLLVDSNSPSLSGMLIEFGFCFYQKKQCVVFWDKKKEEYIPNFINGASKSDKARVQLELFDSRQGEDPIALKKEDWNRYLLDFCGKQIDDTNN
jgi:hypothetical protein